MKKLLAGIVGILLLLGFAYIVPPIINFGIWLFKIDNTDFGFPGWLDFAISSIAGIIAFAAVGIIADFFGAYDKKAMSLTNSIIGIIVGFVIGVLVHAVLQYWYFILAGIGALCVILAVFLIIKKRKET